MIEAFVLGFQEIWDGFFSENTFDMFGNFAGVIVIVLIICAPFGLIPVLAKIVEKMIKAKP